MAFPAALSAASWAAMKERGVTLRSNPACPDEGTPSPSAEPSAEPSPAMAIAAIRSRSPAPRVPLPLPFMCRIDLVRVECTSEGLLVKAAMSVGVSSAPRVWLGGLSAEDTNGAAVGDSAVGRGLLSTAIGVCRSRSLKSLGAGDAESPRCSVARDAAASTSLAVRCMGGKPPASPGSSVCISSNRLPWTPLLDRNSDMTAM